MNIKTIASSSDGCAYTVQFSPYKAKILIECGVSVTTLHKALNGDMGSILACFVSHMHGDHAKYLPALARGYSIPIYCTEETAERYSLPFSVGLDKLDEVLFTEPEIKVRIIKLLHDVPCFGFLIYWGNKKLFYCTDTGRIPYRIEGLTHLMIEANFDYKYIAESDRHEYVVARTIRTHLDIDAVSEFISRHPGLDEIHLLHLSDKHSSEAEFKKRIANMTGVPVYIAQK